MKPFARGHTLGFIKPGGKSLLESLKEFLGRVRRLTGRIQGVLLLDNGVEAELALLLRDGEILAASIGNRKPPSLEEIVRILKNARTGYLEVQELKPSALRYELEYNLDYLYDKAVPIEELLGIRWEGKITGGWEGKKKTKAIAAPASPVHSQPPLLVVQAA